MAGIVSPKGIKIEYAPRRQYVAVRMDSDCMRNSGIVKGSILIVRFQREAEEGSIVLIARNHKSYLRRVKRLGEVVLLVADDPAHEVMTLTDEDFVIGKVVEVKTYFDLANREQTA